MRCTAVCRCHIDIAGLLDSLDMGTADELALDVLLNMLMGFSRECCGIKRICVGGENDTWPLPNRPQEEMPKVGVCVTRQRNAVAV